MKVGRRANVLGGLWRHLKAQKAGDAALGMWVRALSYCADTGRQVLTKRDMATLMAGDKNGHRKLAALVESGLIDEVEGGHTPHDWLDHNPGLREVYAKRTRSEREANVRSDDGAMTPSVTPSVTLMVRNDAEQNQELTPPLSSLQSPVSRKDLTPIAPAADFPSEPPTERPTPDVVKAEYTRRFLAARACPPGWGHKQLEYVRTIAAWVDAMDGDATRLAGRLMDGFFRDPWAADKAFPLGALAGNPSKYFQAPSGAPGGSPLKTELLPRNRT